MTSATRRRRNRPKHETVPYSIYLPPELAAEFEACLAHQRARFPDVTITANDLFRGFVRKGIAALAASPSSSTEDAEGAPVSVDETTEGA